MCHVQEYLLPLPKFLSYAPLFNYFTFSPKNVYAPELHNSLGYIHETLKMYISSR